MFEAPDYRQYTLQQLQDARRSIDARKYPERVAEIDRWIGEHIAQGADVASTGRRDEDDETFLHHRNKSWKPETRFQAIGMVIVSLLFAGLAPALLFTHWQEPGHFEYLFAAVWVLANLYQAGVGIEAYLKLRKAADARTTRNAPARSNNTIDRR